jgi:OmcA/MtrC family decaheme c-type cytochrome
MKHSLLRWGAASLAALAIAGCGGSSSDQAAAPAPVSVKDAMLAAGAVVSNDTATNTSASFTALQAAGVPAVAVNGPPKVSFAVFSDGNVKSDLKGVDVNVVIAKLVPGTNGNPDEWQAYTRRTRGPAVSNPAAPLSAAVEATLAVSATDKGKAALATTNTAGVDPKPADAAAAAALLVYNPDGYYTYTMTTDIKNVAKTNGVTYEPNRTHRVAVQLSYLNAAGQTIKANPYFDFSLDADGKAVAVTDPAKTRKMTDVASCNGCHEKLAMHSGGRVDTQYCVMCHNPGSVDANSGKALTLSTMVHKIHSGKLLKKMLDDGKGGEDYTVRSHGYGEVGFPQDLRNCTVCHSGANPKTPQGDNWKTRPSKEACLTCHANNAGSDWDASHKVFAAQLVGGTAAAKDLSNQQCANCHKAGSAISPENVHWNQNEENAAKYKMNIESTTYDATSRNVTVKYFLSDPTNANAAYNLTDGCAAPATCSNQTKFGNLRFYVAYGTMVGQSTAVTEFSSYNNGGSGANAYAYKGTNDGSNHYTVNITLPADTATSVAFGTARVVSIGQIKEPKLQVKTAVVPRPEVVPAALVNTVVKHTFKELALSGTLQPRRVIVATEKCNVCHGALGTTSGSNTLAEAFHGGARDTVEACVVCHDANRMSATVMTNGLDLNESYQFKRLIHGIHGNSKRTYPFTYGNRVVGAFTNPGGLPIAPGITPMTDSCGRPVGTTGVCLTPPGTVAGPSSVENYAAEVSWPGVGINCNACHVDNSYKSDKGPLGAVIKKLTIAPATTASTDPKDWFVISPKAASCTACHDSSKAMAHVTNFGGATFGNKTPAEIAGLPRESCDDCHSSGGFKGVDIVHGQK